MEEEVKRGRGRPKGSLNKKGRKEPVKVLNEDGTVRGRGRPKGSKNKPKQKMRGRPKGSKSSYTVSEKALIQRRRDSGFALAPAETSEEMDFNARQIMHIMRINEIAANADRNDLLSLKSCFIAYLKLCQEDGFKVGNLAAYAAMGMDKEVFHWLSKKEDPEIRQFVKLVKNTCAMFRESMVSENQLNPVIGIFWQRNFDGLRNDTEQVQAMQEQDDGYSGTSGYKDKYRKLIGAEK